MVEVPADTPVTVPVLPTVAMLAGVLLHTPSVIASLSAIVPVVQTVGSTGIVAGVSAGTSTISYSITNSCGTAIETNVVTVNPLPSAGTIIGTASLCNSSTTALSDATTGGAWSSSSAGTATIGSTGIVTGISAGTSSITYSVTNGCGTTMATSMVTVNLLPSAGTIIGTATICISDTSDLSDAATGGTWSSSTASIATVDVTGIVTGVSTGTAAISYSVTNSCGTADTTFLINVLSPGLCPSAVPAINPVHPFTVKVYPNPNDGVFTILITSDQEEQAIITITNIVGEKVKEFTIATNKAGDIKLYEPMGVYILSATTSHGKYVTKIKIE